MSEKLTITHWDSLNQREKAFIAAGVVVLLGPAAVDAQEEDTAIEPDVTTQVVEAEFSGGINIRSEANTSSEVADILEGGEQFIVLGKTERSDGTWLYGVDSQGNYGWVRHDVVRGEEDFIDDVDDIDPNEDLPRLDDNPEAGPTEPAEDVAETEEPHFEASSAAVLELTQSFIDTEFLQYVRGGIISEDEIIQERNNYRVVMDHFAGESGYEYRPISPVNNLWLTPTQKLPLDYFVHSELGEDAQGSYTEAIAMAAIYHETYYHSRYQRNFRLFEVVNTENQTNYLIGVSVQGDDFDRTFGNVTLVEATIMDELVEGYGYLGVGIWRSDNDDQASFIEQQLDELDPGTVVMLQFGINRQIIELTPSSEIGRVPEGNETAFALVNGAASFPTPNPDRRSDLVHPQTPFMIVGSFSNVLIANP